MDFSLFAGFDYGWAQLMHGMQNGFFNVFFKIERIEKKFRNAQE